MRAIHTCASCGVQEEVEVQEGGSEDMRKSRLLEILKKMAPTSFSSDPSSEEKGSGGSSSDDDDDDDDDDEDEDEDDEEEDDEEVTPPDPLLLEQARERVTRILRDNSFARPIIGTKGHLSYNRLAHYRGSKNLYERKDTSKKKYHIHFLIDVSGSMGDYNYAYSRLGQTISALRHIIPTIKEVSTVRLYAFSMLLEEFPIECLEEERVTPTVIAAFRNVVVAQNSQGHLMPEYARTDHKNFFKEKYPEEYPRLTFDTNAGTNYDHLLLKVLQEQVVAEQQGDHEAQHVIIYMSDGEICDTNKSLQLHHVRTEREDFAKGAFLQMTRELQHRYNISTFGLAMEQDGHEMGGMIERDNIFQIKDASEALPVFLKVLEKAVGIPA